MGYSREKNTIDLNTFLSILAGMCKYEAILTRFQALQTAAVDIVKQIDRQTLHAFCLSNDTNLLSLLLQNVSLQTDDIFSATHSHDFHAAIKSLYHIAPPEFDLERKDWQGKSAKDYLQQLTIQALHVDSESSEWFIKIMKIHQVVLQRPLSFCEDYNFPILQSLDLFTKLVEEKRVHQMLHVVAGNIVVSFHKVVQRVSQQECEALVKLFWLLLKKKLLRQRYLDGIVLYLLTYVVFPRTSGTLVVLKDCPLCLFHPPHLRWPRQLCTCHK